MTKDPIQRSDRLWTYSISNLVSVASLPGGKVQKSSWWDLKVAPWSCKQWRANQSKAASKSSVDTVVDATPISWYLAWGLNWSSKWSLRAIGKSGTRSGLWSLIALSDKLDKRVMERFLKLELGNTSWRSTNRTFSRTNLWPSLVVSQEQAERVFLYEMKQSHFDSLPTSTAQKSSSFQGIRANFSVRTKSCPKAIGDYVSIKAV